MTSQSYSKRSSHTIVCCGSFKDVLACLLHPHLYIRFVPSLPSCLYSPFDETHFHTNSPNGMMNSLLLPPFHRRQCRQLNPFHSNPSPPLKKKKKKKTSKKM
ncbi:hypothetical protein EYC84_010460 [Monilinia fructicola]|uniref:Uncharacterized protein n=1 Tax=Monilinia fructicola TaxID=38448 RepID=A0A5M9JFC8_MONFR|nr:hypothetical protein EYC84_010460 [Monilinia fructicola]